MQKSFISIIVTTKDNESTIGACLESIKHQTDANYEVIVVDNNSKDRTASIAREYTQHVYNLGPERSAQRNFGTSKGKGTHFLFIDSDMELYPDLLADIFTTLNNNPEAKALFIPEETKAEGFWGKCKKFERDFYLIGDMSAEAARLFERSAFENLGGYDITQTGSEDWDMSDRFIAKYPYARTTSRIIHNEGHISLFEQLSKKRYYAKKGINQYITVCPQYRKYIYPFRPSVLRQLHLFVRRPIYGVGSIVLKLAEQLVVFL